MLGLSALLIWGSGVPVRGESVNLALGNPSKATPDQSKKDNYLMEKQFFALSYNNSKSTPNWVSWQLAKADLGKAQRMTFHPDTTLPQGFIRIMPRDYMGGGFDRGHMCPHSDRSANDQMSNATFEMSNMIPQAPNVNQKAWAQLENYCRTLVERQEKTLYIIAGPAGNGGQGLNGSKKTIGTKHSVTVPAKCWKVIMALDTGPGSDLAKVGAKTRLIAVIMPNDETVGEDWRGFRVSVKDVEQLTGFKFFDKLNPVMMELLKEKVDDERIAAPKAPRYAPK